MADAQRAAVIADVMARVALSELRAMRIDSLDRAGAFMLSILRRKDMACMVALNSRAAVIRDRCVRFGPKWMASGLIRELLEFSRLSGADKLLFGMTLHPKWEDLLALNEVYEALRRDGVTLIDIIEVDRGAFHSVFAMLSPRDSKMYEVFQGNKKSRR